MAATYAAVNAIVTLDDTAALASIDKAGIRSFICSLQKPDGSFSLHLNGEIDIRLVISNLIIVAFINLFIFSGVYCALSVAKLCNIPIFSDPECCDNLFASTADWLLKCQTFEGGFGAAPGHEAHGGYTFCGVASLVMLKQLHRCDVESLLHWTVNKQHKLEGGFAGRYVNKLYKLCSNQNLYVFKNQQTSRWLLFVLGGCHCCEHAGVCYPA